MNTRQTIAAQLDAPKTGTKTPKNSTGRAYKSHASAKSGLKQEAPGSWVELNPETGRDLTEETRETPDFKIFLDGPTQAVQKSHISAKNALSRPDNSEELARSPWKKLFWASVVDGIEQEVDPGVFYLLRSSAWLERLEEGTVFVAAHSRAEVQLVDKKARRPLEKALSRELGQAIRVRLEVGQPRIAEPVRQALATTPEESKPDESPSRGEEVELANLHDKFGDIMGIVDNHPLFRKVQAHPNQGGWGLFPQVLTLKCKDYGVLAVLKALRFVFQPSERHQPQGVLPPRAPQRAVRLPAGGFAVGRGEGCAVSRFEVFNSAWDWKIFHASSPEAAVRKAAEYFDVGDYTIAQGREEYFAARKVGSDSIAYFKASAQRSLKYIATPTPLLIPSEYQRLQELIEEERRVAQ